MNKKNLLLSTCAVWFVLCLAAPVISQAETYSYDVAGRLTGVIYDDGSSIIYTYDPAGNRLSRIVSASAVCKGDINGDGNVDLTDAVLALQALVGIDTPVVYRGADVNDDDRIGLAEVSYVLQDVSGLR